MEGSASGDASSFENWRGRLTPFRFRLPNPPQNKLKMKRKYWYITEITECVLCGCGKKHRYRVYEKPKNSIDYVNFACSTHFI